MQRFRLAAAAAILTLAATSVQAACVAGPRTTIAREAADSAWVVHARLRSGDYHWTEDQPSWTLYDVEVVQAFKGAPPSRIQVFAPRDLDGFFMDNEIGDPDLDGAYLLFLNPTPERLRDENEPAGAARITGCGQSRPWDAVSDADLAVLNRLARRR